jgi:hypothetical protein
MTGEDLEPLTEDDLGHVCDDGLRALDARLDAVIDAGGGSTPAAPRCDGQKQMTRAEKAAVHALCLAELKARDAARNSPGAPGTASPQQTA